MRIGIWCVYGHTLAPDDGIGVFVHNLARSLAADPRVEDVLLAIRQGEQGVVAGLVGESAGRIGVAELAAAGRLDRWRLKWQRRRHRGLCAARTPHGRLARRRVERSLVELASRRALRLPSDRVAPDVWFLPHVAEDRPFAAPVVVAVHDMVPLRFPGVIKARDVGSFARLCRVRLRRATLVATMSETIREGDVVGLLGCPREKVRLVRPAVPEDFGSLAPREEVSRRWPFLDRPYLLYPAAFRPYKNHAALVAALAVLHRRGRRDLELVFTGTTPPPHALVTGIRRHGLEDRVRITGPVDRPTLARLYREAAATVVPSLYEQGSFPVLEALYWGCPVAMSAIPALAEAFHEAAGAIPVFDPHAPEAIAAAIERLLDEPRACRDRQAEAFAILARRTWADVAADWIAVFAEAVGRPRAGGGG